MVDHFRASLFSQIISHEVVIKVPVNKTPVDYLQGFCSKFKSNVCETNLLLLTTKKRWESSRLR